MPNNRLCKFITFIHNRVQMFSFLPERCDCSIFIFLFMHRVCNSPKYPSFPKLNSRFRLRDSPHTFPKTFITIVFSMLFKAFMLYKTRSGVTHSDERYHACATPIQCCLQETRKSCYGDD